MRDRPSRQSRQTARANTQKPHPKTHTNPPQTHTPKHPNQTKQPPPQTNTPSTTKHPTITQPQKHVLPFLAPFGRRSPDPPILKSGEKGVLARRVRALQPQKHPQNTPTPKTPPTPPNTPQNTQSFECRACAFMLFGRPGGRAARCPDGSAEAAFEAARERPSTLKPRARGLTIFLTRNIRFLHLLGAGAQTPLY